METFHTSTVYLVYLCNQQILFFENNYSESGRRLGSLMEDTPGRWAFWPERGGGGLSEWMLWQIRERLIRLNGTTLPRQTVQDASQEQYGNTLPEIITEAP